MSNVVGASELINHLNNEGWVVVTMANLTIDICVERMEDGRFLLCGDGLSTEWGCVDVCTIYHIKRIMMCMTGSNDQPLYYGGKLVVSDIPIRR